MLNVVSKNYLISRLSVSVVHLLAIAVHFAKFVSHWQQVVNPCVVLLEKVFSRAFTSLQVFQVLSNDLPVELSKETQGETDYHD
jgi:hypothetical protein